MLFPLNATRCAAAVADDHSGPLQNTCFTMVRLLGERCAFSCLGRDGSDGQACRMIGPCWSPKGTQEFAKRLLQCSGFLLLKHKHAQTMLSILTTPHPNNLLSVGPLVATFVVWSCVQVQPQMNWQRKVTRKHTSCTRMRHSLEKRIDASIENKSLSRKRGRSGRLRKTIKGLYDAQ